LTLNKLTFDFLIKGFIPTQLTQAINFSLPSKQSIILVEKVLVKAIDLFRRDVWNFRCYNFSLVAEHMHNITYNDIIHQRINTFSRPQKGHPSRSFGSLNYNDQSTVISPFPWQSWMMSSFLEKKQWMDFHIRINSH
jgi:hypothetical protein